MKSSFVAALGLCALSLAACDAPNAPTAGSTPAIDASGPGDDVVQFQAQDDAMNAAIEEARTTLPAFLARLDAGHILPTDSLKVGFPANGGHEHIWVNQIARKGDELTGVLANEPNWMPGLHQGSPVTFAVDLVSDWSYQKDGVRWGNYTTRVMLPYLAPEEAEAVRASLSDTPTETTAR
jgi:uncharacterized protein YegJ (DUF2314 family)